MLPSLQDAHWREGAEFSEAWSRVVGNAAGSWGEIFSQVDHEFLEFAPLLKLAAPAKTLQDSLQEFEAAAV